MEEAFPESILDISLCIGALETLNCAWWFIFFPQKQETRLSKGLFSWIRVILVFYEYQVWLDVHELILCLKVCCCCFYTVTHINTRSFSTL
jgi:hypothetical protein